MALFHNLEPKRSIDFMSGARTSSGSPSVSYSNSLPSPHTALVAPLSKMQRALWFDYISAPESTMYNLTLKFKLDQESEEYDGSISAILRAIDFLTKRHGMLRSTFHNSSNPSQPPYFAEIDSRHAHPTTHIVSSSEQLKRAALRGFDLSVDGPIRWIVFTNVKSNELYAVAHHIAVDGSSMSQLSKEIITLLTHYKHQSAEMLAPTTTSNYGLYCLAQDSYTHQESYKKALHFWSSQIAGTLPMEWNSSMLRTNPARLTQTTSQLDHRVCSTWLSLTPQELKAWGNLYKTSWFRVATALIGLLCAKHSKHKFRTDQSLLVAFGARPEQSNDVLGHFANGMPIKIPISMLERSESAQLGGFVKEVSKNISAAKREEMFPYVDLVQHARRNGLNSEHRVSVTFSPKLASDICSLYPVEGVCDLFFCFLEEEDGGAILGLIYDPQLFTPDAIQTLREDFIQLIRFSLSPEDATQSLASFPGLSARQQFNGPPLHDVVAIDQCRVHALVQQQATLRPEQLALYSEELQMYMTYEELEMATNQAAHCLRACGSCKGEVVALHLSHGFDMIIWIYAAFKSGAAFTVVDPSYPPTRKSAIFELSKAKICVYDSKTAPSLQWAIDENLCSVFITTAGSDNTPIDRFPTHPLTDEGSTLDDLAYIIFTSGSTGLPKGVMVAHRQLSHFVSAARDCTPVGPSVRALQVLSFSFDAAVLEYAATLVYGGTLCFAEHRDALVGDYLADVVDANKINHLTATPSILATLPAAREMPTLRSICVGGEHCPEGVLNTWRQRVQLIHAYGPTETTVAVTLHRLPREIDPEEVADGVSPSSIMGKPLPNVKIYVCDTSRRILKNGKIGELHISGPQVSRGYIDREELNAEKFWINEHGERTYASGDRGRILPDGTVLLYGRINNREIKVRGYRLELGEIEKMITKADTQVRTVSVQANVTGDGLLAFVTPRTVDTEALRLALAKYAPRYMIPSEILAIDALPCTVNDKVDHARVQRDMADLRARASKLGTASLLTPNDTPLQSPSPPLSDISQLDLTDDLEWAAAKARIAEIWRQVLAAPGPILGGVKFFEAGGNSLLVLKLKAEIEGAFGVKVSFSDLFQNSTVDSQVGLVQSRRGSSGSPRTVRSHARPQRKAKTPPRQARPETPESDYDQLPDLRDDVQQSICSIWMEVLGYHGKLDAKSNFFELGGTSLQIPILHKALLREFPASNVSLVKVFQSATLAAQVELLGRFTESPRFSPRPAITPSAAVVSRSPRRPSSPAREQYAIVGMSGRFPGASTIPEFWDLLVHQRDGIQAIGGLEDAPLGPNEVLVQRRGLIKDVEHFDHEFWKMPKNYALRMDPQKRHFLNVALEALDDAGIELDPQGQNDVGIFVGSSENTFREYCATRSEDAFEMRHSHHMDTAVSATAAYYLNTFGPNVTLNTACSSALVALKLGMDALATGQTKVVCVGGCTIEYPLQGYITEPGKVLSTTGEVRPFDAASDGSVPGDAVCAVIIKRATDALADGDQIYAFVDGAAVGSDGHLDKPGITVPSPRGQAETIKRAMQQAHARPEQIAHVEVHGSGTRMGDALELEGLSIAYDQHLGRQAGQRPVSVGSNKGNFGNCEAASGLVSIIKAALSISNGVVPPLRKLETVGDHVDFMRLNLTPAREPLRLSRHDKVGVTSLGLGGSTAHVVLSAPPGNARRTKEWKQIRELHPTLLPCGPAN
ncbi:hypothetical protein BOTBODRAFT_28419 [Botryobasidium botryosum FD-172 SS1]|uniref:Hybrid PKS-NRPS synthetase TAS1 n=1 Tax=Botryobasidium botryosum (strain FD-172 SS1) TaxID=930990 RepID=TAS1_BOTB1|nr:hypothetical protein BOTBODRAFT_28419 [Botryobasidium botryosum FD-172 SS1]